MTSQPQVEKFFIGLMALAGLLSLSQGLLQMHFLHHAEFGTLFASKRIFSSAYRNRPLSCPMSSRSAGAEGMGHSR